MRVSQELIDEATRRGIVPGAIISSANGVGDGTVAPYDEWEAYDHGGQASWLKVGRVGALGLFAMHRGGDWDARVVTLSQQGQGLKDGDVVRGNNDVLLGLLKIADALGIPNNSAPHYGAMRWAQGQLLGTDGNAVPTGTFDGKPLTERTLGEFISRMEVAAKLPRPVRIDGHAVKYEKGFVIVGCRRIPNADVDTIHANLMR